MLLLRSKQARNRICAPRRVWNAAASATHGTRTLRQRYTSAGNLTQPIQWSSECFDPETALVYYNYRYYNPQDGRWTRRDPIGVAGGVNVYVICNNNQNSFVDIYGLQTTSCDQVHTAVKLADCLQQKGIDTSKTTLGGTLTTDQGTLSVEKSYGNKSGWGKINCTPGKKGTNFSIGGNIKF